MPPLRTGFFFGPDHVQSATDLFKGRQRGAIFVVATMKAGPIGAGPKNAQLVLQRFLRILKPASYYARTVVREASRPDVHLVFVAKGDAQSWPLSSNSAAISSALAKGHRRPGAGAAVTLALEPRLA